MSDWQQVALGEICTIEIGGTPSRSEAKYWWKTGDDGARLPWVSISDMKEKVITNTKESITEIGALQSNCKHVPKGTLLMSFKLTIGRLAFAGRDLYTNEAISAISPFKDVCPEFLYYGLQYWNLTGDSDQAVKGVTLNKQKLQEIPCLLPPLPEQKKIAEILSGIDSLANRLSTLYQKRQEFLRSLSLSLLGLRHCHSKFHYHPVSLGNCITLSRGVDITKTCMVPGPYPVISSSGVSGWHNSFTHETEGVVVGRKGSIGNVHYAETAHWVHDTSLGISDYKGNNKRYIYHLLKNLDLANFGTASGSPSLNRNDVHPIAVNLPSHADQIQIATILDAEEAFSHGLQKKIFTIKHLKKSVASDLLSGRKRVTL